MRVFSIDRISDSLGLGSWVEFICIKFYQLGAAIFLFVLLFYHYFRIWALTVSCSHFAHILTGSYFVALVLQSVQKIIVNLFFGLLSDYCLLSVRIKLLYTPFDRGKFSILRWKL